METIIPVKRVLEFLRICGRLKQVKRSGWVRNKIPNAESVADHMYRMSMCCMLLSDTRIDQNKCIMMSIVHDLAEAVVGDITPHDGVSKEEKPQREKKAMDEICSVLGSDCVQASTIQQLWNEYEDGSTIEALFVKDFDKFEMLLQAHEYEKEHNTNLDDFFTSTNGRFRTDLIRSWVEQLEKER
uniref:5'-deoxynucleotidase n=1 Tax=Albugo laibachii Nc14 TaxID=890382 RepID=F0WK62_9STRA|nr:PREDICTED: hypothetical protein isoform 1 [Albugo laibachii Nc14]|eukprot:CCA21664.1 PREDICTED: hypothetical protein isoform 1 [Albugo laibachii Nc14]